MLSTVSKFMVLLNVLDPFDKNFLQFSIIEFKICGTPGKHKTFLILKPKGCAGWIIN